MVLGLLLFGALSFLAALYFIGTGDPAQDSNDGGAHSASNSLTGYSALAELLRAGGQKVTLLRDQARLNTQNLLILTPPPAADGKEIARIVKSRRRTGPTIVILPKWKAIPADQVPGIKAKPGWVVLGPAAPPNWPGFYDEITVKLTADKARARWQGAGLSGKLPDPKNVLTGKGKGLEPIVTGAEGEILAAYLNDGGVHPDLEDMAGTAQSRLGDDDKLYPLVMVFEPDLMNNYGMADRSRAQLALRIIDATRDGSAMPIDFDLTLNGLGGSANLLTLAFTPPFLAATLCLLLAAIVVAWRALRRFGPPLAAQPIFAFGKRQLATNSAALIERSKRWHLLGAPYGAMLRGRIAHLLGLRAAADGAGTDSEIDRLLVARGIAPADFSEQAEALRLARTPQELLRRAHALKQIERKLAR